MSTVSPSFHFCEREGDFLFPSFSFSTGQTVLSKRGKAPMKVIKTTDLINRMPLKIQLMTINAQDELNI